MHIANSTVASLLKTKAPFEEIRIMPPERLQISPERSEGLIWSLFGGIIMIS